MLFINDMIIQWLIAIGTLGGIALALAAVLILANRKLYVEEDPRIDELEAMLPNSNCGACGFAGCRAFAQALTLNQATPAQCTVSSDQGHETIANYLGVATGEIEKIVARLACAGGSNVSRAQARYQGLSTCRAAAQVGGGGKGCSWGCLGYGDCADICQFDAIVMNNHQLPVVNESNCTACGDCVDICPKDLFSLQAASQHLWVACSNKEFGDSVLNYCEVACTACGKCALDGANYIQMHHNLPVIDYGFHAQTQQPIERCPTGAIIWIDANGAIIKGRESKRPVRIAPLGELPT